ncbi:alkylation response protein AidB-like acyl-CoA dehydrogenase [Catenuloplanes nepalensis]|uniref:Alkylation response protein AidB-like acyl-CoA dehydrogenase n=1 Tax=Catenuloplanes nepalensis TaxID=587533 RepID=A0ABT9MVY3_9ACTN|nr:acyl-CoA dehydrogenase family protein [Catenuloplanes nepalensis]MDP9795607.1 alkylation response protein AidB-like acyl-CoA dehydrogenase [Catenuloplanes nepalensis]
MNLLYSQDEESLRDSLRDLLRSRTAPPDDGFDAEVWRLLGAELGVVGLVVPETFGGAGASLREAALVMEELGRFLTPVPYLGCAVMAVTALRVAGDTEVLPRIADGSAWVALAVPFAGALPDVTVVDGVLTGRIESVADALAADVLLVPAGGDLYEVAAAGPGVTRTPVVSLDVTRPLVDLTLTAAPGRPIGPAPEAVDAAVTAGAALLASEQLGVAEWCLDTTVEYARTRLQFGRPIGSFQAIKHRLADVWVSVTQSRAVARYAAGAVSDASEPRLAAALAQAHCGPVAVRAAEECVQLHGGIGFTWEHPAHLYLKRAKTTSIALGTAAAHRRELAGLLDLTPAGSP